jgi:hypothetical protein
MSGAAVWVGDRIVGVVAKHHPGDGPGRLTAVRVDALQAALPDVTPVPASKLVATAYRAQITEIAPAQLHDRSRDLADLVRFCAGEAPYEWLQAPPWAGKTALLSSFVLQPPSGVDVVSFFITGRFTRCLRNGRGCRPDRTAGGAGSRGTAADRDQQEELQQRNNIPFELPAVWIAIGDHARAVALANGIDGPDNRVRALCAMADAALELGLHDDARRLAAQAEAQAAETSDAPKMLEVQTLTTHARAVAACGDFDHAERVAGQLPDVHLLSRIVVLFELASMAALAGDRQRAARLSAEAQASVSPADAIETRLTVLAGHADAAASAGDVDQVARLVHEAEVLMSELTVLNADTVHDLGRIARTLARYDAGHAAEFVSRTETIIQARPHSAYPQADLMIDLLVEAWAEAGDFDRAETILGKITNVPTKARALTALAEHLIEAGHTLRARRLIAEVLCTRHWQQTLSLVAKIDPAAFRTACDALLAKVN